ncbi:MAG: hypothetical protein NVS3B1_30020 [Marmoricola sp.]
MEGHETPSTGEDELRARAGRKKERRRALPLLPEVRHWTASGLEVRSASKTDEIVISGTPIVYDTPYTVTDMFGEFSERMAPGVAAETLARGADVRFLFNHDGLPLARSTSGTLSLEDSSTALTFTARLDARQQLANDLAVAIERGDVTQMSCGFCVASDEWDEGMENRTIFRFSELLDVSAVTYPASPTTSIQVARRMALEMPVESRARARRAVADLKAGKTLPADRVEALRSMLSTDLDPGEELSPAEVREDAAAEAAETVTDTAPVEERAEGAVETTVDEPSKTSRATLLRVKLATRRLP